MHEVFESNYGFCSLCYSEEFTLFYVKFHLPFVCPVFFFLHLIEGLFLDVTLQVVQPVASCSVQHHQVSFTTVQRTLAGNVLCGVVCSATLTRC